MPREHDEHDEDFQALAELAEGFMALVAALHDGDQPRLTPERICDLAMRCMPRAQHVGLVAQFGDTLRPLAASSAVPEAVDRIRTATGEGPALDVIDVNDLVLVDDLRCDARWPGFGRRTVDETGMLSLVAYRLSVGPRQRGALSFYSDWPYAFDGVALSTGAIFASYASLVTSGIALDQPVHRTRSEQVHREIGVAVGILMASGGLSTASAYRRLHEASRRLRRTLPQTARAIVEHRGLPDGEPPR